ncbi:hypothetical protein F4779DRAFT_30894 [Xylariaceae sp. FL0662B]|nr:hypothetical protein F4779DRAFT_30894 [Xylariaceae sp. FL0662B]
MYQTRRRIVRVLFFFVRCFECSTSLVLHTNLLHLQTTAYVLYQVRGNKPSCISLRYHRPAYLYNLIFSTCLRPRVLSPSPTPATDLINSNYQLSG